MIVKIVSTTVGQYEPEYNVIKAFHSKDELVADVAAHEFIDEQQKKTKDIKALRERLYEKVKDWESSHPNPTRKRGRDYSQKEHEKYCDALYDYKKSVAAELIKEREDLNLEVEDILFNIEEVYYEIEDLEVVELD